MRPFIVLLALAAPLIGCSNARNTAADTPEQAECRRVARNDPAVRDALRPLSPGNNDQIIQGEVNRATDRAFRNCLRDRGLPGGGGVEIPPPR
jgi:hypothetical protein